MGRKDDIIERVRAVAEPLAAQEGLELVDVQLGGAGRTELTLFIDKLPGSVHASDAPKANMLPASDAHPDADTSILPPVGLPSPSVNPIDDADTVEARPLEFIKHDPSLDETELELEGPASEEGSAVESAGPGAARPGVSLDDCANFSRIVSAALDVEDPLDGSYELVVSSPGLDRPLRTPAHFEKYAGKRVRVKTYAPVPGAGERKNFVGKLLGFDAAKNAVLIDVDGAHFEVPHKAISKANLEPVFDL